MMKEKLIIVHSNLNIPNLTKINKFIIFTNIMNKKNLLSLILSKVNVNLQTYSKIQI